MNSCARHKVKILYYLKAERFDQIIWRHWIRERRTFRTANILQPNVLGRSVRFTPMLVCKVRWVEFRRLGNIYETSRLILDYTIYVSPTYFMGRCAVFRLPTSFFYQFNLDVESKQNNQRRVNARK